MIIPYRIILIHPVEVNFSFGRLDVDFSRWFGHLENCIRVAIFLLAESSMLYLPLSVTPASVLHWRCDTYFFATAKDWNLVFSARIP